jgi:hypothetical protein
MDDPSPSVKGIGDQSQEAQKQRGDENARPNKNSPDHNIK